MHFTYLPPPADLIPRCRDAPPPKKSCLVNVDEDLEELPSDEPFVRKSVHFADDVDLVQVRVIPARNLPPRCWRENTPLLGRVAEDKWRKELINYSPHRSANNNRLPSQKLKSPKRRGPKARSARPHVRCPGRFGAAYAAEPSSPRFQPSSDGSQATLAADCFIGATISFRGQPPVTAVCGPLPQPLRGSTIEPAIDGSRAAAFDMSTLSSALFESHTLDMSALQHALPKLEATGTAFQMAALVEALPDLDGSCSPGTSPLTPVPKSLAAPFTSNSPPEVGHSRVVVQARVQVGPMVRAWSSHLSWVLFVLAFIFPRLAPAVPAVWAFLIIAAACT
ncbi:uncharacterized protein N7515_009300 [Penicillium bovifimosum]|uniref:Uncharacterized protein n=1 Tax=Penicillium bovifimosum TaxID=126998 RepID=A0A9W9GJ97_9EURO|nr:uncharacterized protein N7515_009300 [Penicillium bovifimosum]KAJ5121339.1 hypothetical protein N7515_009300 [Penicillium bovifimosum]